MLPLCNFAVLSFVVVGMFLLLHKILVFPYHDLLCKKTSFESTLVTTQLPDRCFLEGNLLVLFCFYFCRLFSNITFTFTFYLLFH